MNNNDKILKLVLLMAFADKVYMAEEKELINDLSNKLKISKEKLDEKLSFLIEKGFLSKNKKDNKIFYSLNVDRLSEILENDDNFKNIDDGLAKLDSFN